MDWIFKCIVLSFVILSLQKPTILSMEYFHDDIQKHARIVWVAA